MPTFTAVGRRQSSTSIRAEAYGYLNRALPDAELGAGWDACIATLGRPAAQEGIKPLIARGFHRPGDVENRLGYYLGQIAPGRRPTRFNSGTLRMGGVRSQSWRTYFESLWSN